MIFAYVIKNIMLYNQLKKVNTPIVEIYLLNIS